MIFTNLPINLSNTILASKATIVDHLVSNVHKDIDVKSVEYLPALDLPTQPSRMAYIKVAMGSKRQAYMVMGKLRNTWIGDQLLKIKTQEDIKKEVYDNRTVLIRGLPTNWTQRDIIQTFVPQEQGALVGIELPMENTKVAELLDERASSGANSAVALERDA